MGNKDNGFLVKLRSVVSQPSLHYVTALAGIVISIFLYYMSERGSELRFAVKPSRVEMVNTSWASLLSIRYQGSPVEGGITVAQVALWNAGRTPIGTEDVVDQIEIYTDPAVPILNASLRSARKATNMSLDRSLFARGRLPVRWKVLERGDGGVVEILYNGPPSVGIFIRGDLLDPGYMSTYSNQVGFESPEEEFRLLRRANRNRRILSLPLGALALCGLLYVLSSSRKAERPPLEGRSDNIFVVVLIVLFICCIVMYVTSWYPSPPVGL